MEPRRATLASMGLRSERAVARHILEENTWESNLIPDIAGLDYLAGHQGKTNLQPLEGLPSFSDDFYIYGPLQNDEIVRVRGQRPMCTTGEEDCPREYARRSLLLRRKSGTETCTFPSYTQFPETPPAVAY